METSHHAITAAGQLIAERNSARRRLPERVERFRFTICTHHMSAANVIGS